MRTMTKRLYAAVAAAVLMVSAAGCSNPGQPDPAATTTSSATTSYDGPSSWIALGTGAGGIPQADRSQPANLLTSDGQNILVDVGAGAVNQLAKAEVAPSDIDAVVISHLHFDHTGGLFALLGLRLQVPGDRKLTIYGPKGTKAMVDGLLAAEKPAAGLFSAMDQDYSNVKDPASGVKVVEVSDGESLDIGSTKLTAAQNTHYNFKPGSPDDLKYPSLSLRFELPDRTIGYTGDTSSSDAVTKLMTGTDLLVSSVIDPEAALADVVAKRPDLPQPARDSLVEHFKKEHLTPQAVGDLASAAKPKSLVLTHKAIDVKNPASVLSTIGDSFSGKTTIANDLDRF